MSTVHMWAGASSDTSFWVRAKVTGSSTRLAVSEADDLSSPAFFGGPETPTADGMVSIVASGLTAGTRYYYAIEDDTVLDTTFVGTVLTHPVTAGERASYVFGAAGDAGLTGAGDDSHITDQVSDNPVFDTMRQQSLADNWLFFAHLGDLHYRDIGTASDAAYRTAYDDVLTFNDTLGADARQGHFLRSAAVTYVWDDHDFGPNNSDSTAAGRDNACTVYRERMPHYTLPAGAGANPIYQSWQIGRVLYIASDVRADRDPNSDPQGPSKTLLGSAQKSWIESTLTADTGAEALVWITPSRWIGGSDTWSSFLHERDEMVQLFGDLRWIDRMILLTADEHALAISSGPNNRYGAFPMFMFASMDASFSTGTDGADPTYNIGRVGGRQQYGTMRVQDDGHTIALTGTGYINGAAWKSHTKYAHVGNPLFAVSYPQLSPQMEPVDDDKASLNDLTLRREGGGEVRHVETEGPMSVLPPPDGVGTYDGTGTINVASDEQLGSQASWRVHKGTTEGPRHPKLRIDLGAVRSLSDTAALLEPGDQITVSDPPLWLPPDPIEQLTEGYTESLAENKWDLEPNLSPAAPWQVMQLPPGDEETAQPDQPNRLDTSGSELTTAVTDVGTEFLVHTPQDGVHDRAVWLNAMRVFNDNWDFETDLSGWVGNGATIARVATPGSPPFPGSWSLQLTPDGVAEFPNAGSDQFAVVPGESYTVSGWLRCDVARGVDLNINWFDAGHNYLSTGSNGISVEADTWAFIQGTFTAPGTAAFANMAPTMDGFPPASNVLYGDILTIRPAGGMPEQSPYDLRLGGETVRATSVEPLHWDAFGRTETDTWGTSSSGLVWVETGGAATDRAVAGGVGTITLASAPDTIRFQRSTDDVGDCEVHVTMSPDQVATGASMIPAILFRHTGASDYYRARLHFSTGGGMFTSVSRGTTQIGTAKTLLFSYSAGETFHLRGRLIWHRILIRAWPDDQAEPVVWHNDEEIGVADGQIDSGGVGLTCSAFGGNTNVNPVVSYDQFEVVTPQRIVVQRSLNGVVKAHAVGVAVSLARPAVLGL